MTFYGKVIRERSLLWFFLICLPPSTKSIGTPCYSDLRRTSASRVLLCRSSARTYLVALNPFCVMVVHPPVVQSPEAFLKGRFLVPCFFASTCVLSSLSCKSATLAIISMLTTYRCTYRSILVNDYCSQQAKRCLADIRSWMSNNSLKLNVDKTDIRIGNPKRIA